MKNGDATCSLSAQGSRMCMSSLSPDISRKYNQSQSSDECEAHMFIHCQPSISLVQVSYDDDPAFRSTQPWRRAFVQLSKRKDAWLADHRARKKRCGRSNALGSTGRELAIGGAPRWAEEIQKTGEHEPGTRRSRENTSAVNRSVGRQNHDGWKEGKLLMSCPVGRELSRVGRIGVGKIRRHSPRVSSQEVGWERRG